MTALNPILNFLTQPSSADATAILPLELTSDGQDDTSLLQNLNAAFLIILAGETHPSFAKAHTYLDKLSASPDWGKAAKFYAQSAQLIAQELEQACGQDAEFKANLDQMAATLADTAGDTVATANAVWSVLFPEGTGIWGQEAERVDALREKRTVAIDHLNPNPIENPAKQVLFTSNALLTMPLASTDLSEFDADFQAELAEAADDPQLYWYDHPIPIGIGEECNEILYGLKHLNHAVEFEREQSGITDKVNCVLSVSVTHERLQTLGKSYLKQVLAASEPLEQLNIFAFTETDTTSLIDKVLLPILEHFAPDEDAKKMLAVFGVDGRYGRHYSFLKAISALWNSLVDPDIKATFKIDLDQVFPQAELLEQTGATAFGHLQTPLWGATGQDSSGQPIELGMIAGALVNQRDIHNGVFTPDVTVPDPKLSPDEYVFFSKLPQALSTEAEMMTRYATGTDFDGETKAIQRIHVTGGTNGILVDSLRRYRTFTPSFIGRAEDQAYILSARGQQPNLGYAHASGLIMRHDKEGFAQEAIAMAKVGKQVGDYLRILLFSANANALPEEIGSIKSDIDPFTGCFVSQLPITVAMLRFSLKVANLFNAGKSDEATEFINTGVSQLQEGLDFIQGDPSELQQTYEHEEAGWQLFYQALDTVEKSLQAGEDWALGVQKETQRIVENCRVN
ncbi:hypothetical protein IQ260_13455 [Leptolyngbya cf. ectocarpi LEGE 11479]|uniref:Uncharacterized protein n=1 Tax=Leptolyngbya cf. ectocarpi LEGE 11479 TaxID=1828722 RepID=A0A928ZUF5_LEPEC|nr:hypothetical protein [Leptolyngbya ectocarpi]MBE9067662.1 hypothetical protein [Leptolyngbya cf. ectocarpi LEGE 11479]